ncbi:hypothetical protein DRE_06626 [Drechslerella stenobrocha 248]|uniref:Uncharacterized protein n=1 Tax=Drechslerella stenobrocha 248 TaxID=1043628 RepID=W7HX11_9PEZI|nr:hypothetical protein DRE_06626 [Drechslerella stenobrocha 248]
MHGLAGDIIRFSNNTAGMEKILKGLVGLLLLPSTPTFQLFSPVGPRVAGKLDRASKEIGIARKVVKILYVLDAALKALEARRGAKGGPLKWIIFGKWFCSFLYAASETVTILHHMGVLNDNKSHWAKAANQKGSKIYFISIVFSIMASAYQLIEITIAERQISKARRKAKAQKYRSALAYSSSAHRDRVYNSDDFSSSTSSSDEEDTRRREDREREAAKIRASRQSGYPGAASEVGSGSSGASPSRNPTVLSAEARLSHAAEWERKKLFVDATRTSGTKNAEVPRTGPIVTQLMADVCDLAIPAGKLGWYGNKEAVSAAHVVSSFLAGGVIWGRVNAKPATETGPGEGRKGSIQMVKKNENRTNGNGTAGRAERGRPNGRTAVPEWTENPRIIAGAAEERLRTGNGNWTRDPAAVQGAAYATAEWARNQDSSAQYNVQVSTNEAKERNLQF